MNSVESPSGFDTSETEFGGGDNGGDGGGLPKFSDVYLADKFITRNLDRFRYVSDMGHWLVWQGTHWPIDRKNEVRHAIKESNCLIAEDAKTPSDKRKMASGKAIREVEGIAKADPRFAILSKELDTAPFLLGTPGGTVNLTTGQMQPAEPRDYITRITTFAPALVADCPQWLIFLAEAADKDEAYIRFLKQWFGYSLTADIREQSLMFMYGPGGNGKGVLMNTVRNIVGDYGHTAAVDVFLSSNHSKHTTSIASLNGARLVIANESDEDRSWDSAMIRSLTSGDTISARLMRQDDVEFTPKLKLTIASNHKPNLKSVMYADKRRINILPFLNRPKKVDNQLGATLLREEGPAILRWLIDGCLDWQNNGLDRPQVVLDATAEYFADQDLFSTWLEECCVFGDEEWTKRADLTASWARFVNASGTEASMSATNLYDKLREHGLEATKRRGIRGFRGVKLNQAQANMGFPKDYAGSGDSFDGDPND